MGRLTAAAYSHNATVVGRTPKYSESFTYDAMGNITSLTRQGFLYGTTWGDIDDLEMEYEGNRMVKCDDAAAVQPTYSDAHHFTDLADATTEYEYDGNGNMTNFSIKREQSKLVCSAEREKSRVRLKDLKIPIKRELLKFRVEFSKTQP